MHCDRLLWRIPFATGLNTDASLCGPAFQSLPTWHLLVSIPDGSISACSKPSTAGRPASQLTCRVELLLWVKVVRKTHICCWCLTFNGRALLPSYCHLITLKLAALASSSLCMGAQCTPKPALKFYAQALRKLQFYIAACPCCGIAIMGPPICSACTVALASASLPA